MDSSFHEERRQLLAQAREDLNNSSGDFEQAERALFSHLKKMPQYRDTLIFIAARELLSVVRTSLRGEILAGSIQPGSTTNIVTTLKKGETSKPNPLMAEARLRNAGKEHLDFPMLGGRGRLRDAVYDDVAASETYYLSQGRTMVIRGRWLGMVKNSLPDRTTKVSDVLTEEKLVDLYEQSESQFT